MKSIGYNKKIKKKTKQIVYLQLMKYCNKMNKKKIKTN